MSEENVETLRAFYAAYNAGHFDGAGRYIHPEVEIYPAIGGELDFARVYRRRDGFREWWDRTREGFEVTVKIEEVLQAAEDRVLQVELWGPHGRQGIATEIEVSDLYSFRDGLVSRIDGFRDRAQALEAAGLSD
jgi:ketosteroid isomerase-like protein